MHLGGTVASDDLVRNRGSHQRHVDHVSIGVLDRLLDRHGDLGRLPVPPADPAVLVADDDQG